MVYDQSLWDDHQYSAEDKIDQHDLNMLKTEHIELNAPKKLTIQQMQSPH